ncbi:PilZ domain-containing protein [Roseibium sp.]|uniref:PilZ domain-containing protein n=1 Tax=Roseibium sp. TaxID=1936156 RepID=UPI003A97EF32
MQELMVAGAQTDAAPALVVDLDKLSCVEAKVYGLTEKGCTVVCEQVHLLKDEIGLRLNDVKTMLRGKIVSHSGNEAQVSFSSEKSEPVEKRREPRRRVLITAVVCSRVGRETLRCHIVDASKSGCRLESDQLHKLPDEIEISIPKLDMPLVGTIVWRSGEFAGVSLNWPFSENPESKAPNERIKPEDQAAEMARRRGRGGAFGVR